MTTVEFQLVLDDEMVGSTYVYSDNQSWKAERRISHPISIVIRGIAAHILIISG